MERTRVRVSPSGPERRCLNVLLLYPTSLAWLLAFLPPLCLISFLCLLLSLLPASPGSALPPTCLYTVLQSKSVISSLEYTVTRPGLLHQTRHFNKASLWPSSSSTSKPEPGLSPPPPTSGKRPLLCISCMSCRGRVATTSWSPWAPLPPHSLLLCSLHPLSSQALQVLALSASPTPSLSGRPLFLLSGLFHQSPSWFVPRLLHTPSLGLVIH